MIVTYHVQGKKQLYVARPDNVKHPSKFNIRNFINKSYQFMYDPKKNMLLYNNGFKRKEMRVYDNSWGNIISALTDLQNPEWINKNAIAKKVQKIDPVNFNEMEHILSGVLEAINKQKEKD